MSSFSCGGRAGHIAIRRTPTPRRARFMRSAHAGGLPPPAGVSYRIQPYSQGLIPAFVCSIMSKSVPPFSRGAARSRPARAANAASRPVAVFPACHPKAFSRTPSSVAGRGGPNSLRGRAVPRHPEISLPPALLRPKVRLLPSRVGGAENK